MVKVLDFGLAQALAGDTGSDPSESPTLTATATRAGVIMGTAAYMSPEQARGKTVDKELQRLVPHAVAIASAWHVPMTFLLSGLGGSWQPVATVWEDRQDA